MQVLLFPAYGNDGIRIADAKEEGSFTVELIGGEAFTWRLPLGSVLPPKVCPVDGEQMSGVWTYCPRHGAELESVRP